MSGLLAAIPSPPANGVHVGPVDVRVYGLMYIIGITLAILIARRRWTARGGSPELVYEVALWGVPAGLIGGRIYFDLTTPKYVPPHWWGPLAIWDGGLGIWGGIALATVVGVWRLRRRGVDVGAFMDAAVPGVLVAQAVGRIGNYFNQELFGGPSTLPWAIQIDPAHRPAGYLHHATFHPTFLYELLFDLALAGALVWLGHHRRIRPPGLFALYVAGYSAFRIFEESLRVDPAQHFLGLRLNFYVASALTVAGLAWFARLHRRRLAGRSPVARASAVIAVAVAAALAGCGDGQNAHAAGRGAHPLERPPQGPVLIAHREVREPNTTYGSATADVTVGELTPRKATRAGQFDAPCTGFACAIEPRYTEPLNRG